jgi:hypothetical protein
MQLLVHRTNGCARPFETQFASSDYEPDNNIRVGKPNSEAAKQSGLSTLTLQMNDLELLHHYTTSTYLTLTQDSPEHEHVWQIVVPQLAVKHPFLMHGILASSALHLAHVLPERQQEYTVLAANHESMALPAFRSEAETSPSRIVLPSSHSPDW